MVLIAIVNIANNNRSAKKWGLKFGIIDCLIRNLKIAYYR